MNYFRICCPAMVLFILVLMFAVSAQTIDERSRNIRIERIKNIVNSVDIDTSEVETIRELIDNVQLSFLEIIKTLSVFEERMSSKEEKRKIAILQNHNIQVERDRGIYFDNISRLLRYLDDNLTENQIADFYRFLFDELWYENFINESSAQTRSAIDFTAVPTFDSTSLINQYTYEELEEMEEEYIESENEALTSENAPPDSIYIERETVLSVSRAPAEIKNENVIRPAQPPWHGMPASPATTQSIRNLLENQSLPALKYYWTELYPTIDSLYNVEKR